MLKAEENTELYSSHTSQKIKNKNFSNYLKQKHACYINNLDHQKRYPFLPE